MESRDSRDRDRSERERDSREKYARMRDEDDDYEFGAKSSLKRDKYARSREELDAEAEARGRVASAHEMIDTISPQLEGVMPEENYLLKYTTPALSATTSNLAVAHGPSGSERYEDTD